MKKQNDIILISVVITIVLLITLVSVSLNLILEKNEIIQKIQQVKEESEEQINGELHKYKENILSILLNNIDYKI